jgi:hypothetical protein
MKISIPEKVRGGTVSLEDQSPADTRSIGLASKRAIGKTEPVLPEFGKIVPDLLQGISKILLFFCQGCLAQISSAAATKERAWSSSYGGRNRFAGTPDEERVEEISVIER